MNIFAIKFSQWSEATLSLRQKECHQFCKTTVGRVKQTRASTPAVTCRILQQFLQTYFVRSENFPGTKSCTFDRCGKVKSVTWIPPFFQSCNFNPTSRWHGFGGALVIQWKKRGAIQQNPRRRKTDNQKTWKPQSLCKCFLPEAIQVRLMWKRKILIERKFDRLWLRALLPPTVRHSCLSLTERWLENIWANLPSLKNNPSILPCTSTGGLCGSFIKNFIVVMHRIRAKHFTNAIIPPHSSLWLNHNEIWEMGQTQQRVY